MGSGNIFQEFPYFYLDGGVRPPFSILYPFFVLNYSVMAMVSSFNIPIYVMYFVGVQVLVVVYIKFYPKSKLDVAENAKKKR